MKRKVFYGIGLVACIILACNQRKTITKNSSIHTPYLSQSRNILNYQGTPKDKKDKSMLMFSDQGAWFAYSIPDSTSQTIGFSGPFLLTQENGVWSSNVLTSIDLIAGDGQIQVDWNRGKRSHNSYLSHLEQVFENDSLVVNNSLVFGSGHTAFQLLTIKNISNKTVTVQPRYSGTLFNIGNTLTEQDGYIHITSSKTPANAYIGFSNFESLVIKDSLSYQVYGTRCQIEPQEQKQIKISHTFIFPEYSWEKEKQMISSSQVDSILLSRKMEKEDQLRSLKERLKLQFDSLQFFKVQAKALLTLQNNWRISAGALEHQGLFPSYHYEWFHGFWSWDSWKQAVGLSYYNNSLAKDQMRAMFDFQSEDGFIVDCIFRDTTIEKHNYRDTKPPLATWAVLKIFQ